jgi:hypothetical protein
MGRVSIEHYTVKHGRGYWQPRAHMRKLGFYAVRARWSGRLGDRAGVEPAMARG